MSASAPGDPSSPVVPSPPEVRIEVVADRSAKDDSGFLRLRRLQLKNHYPKHPPSPPYAYDMVERGALDAVTMLLFTEGPTEPLVCLRSSLRPPLWFRAELELPIKDPEPNAVLWEIPAGLIEKGETGIEGIRRCAARETMEEAGFDLPPDDFHALGGPVALSPGVIGERIYFVSAEVELSKRVTPTEDGSPVEAHAQVLFVPLSEAMAAVDDGRVADAKSEIALRRFVAAREAS